MKSPSPVIALLVLTFVAFWPGSPDATAALPQIPAPLAVPAPGPTNEAAYAPQPILPGGIVMPLYAPDSPLLKQDRVREAEQYNLSKAAPGRVSSIVNIHNPSIEVHTVEGGLNTGAAVILAAGGGHNTLNVGSESADFVPYFYNYGVNTVILRNRLRRDGYNVQSDAVNDALQAIRLVRAHAKNWNIDPNKIGIMGFSAGAELAAPAAIFFEEFDKKHADPADPLAGVSARPDFVGLVYPGPTPFARDASPPIPRTVLPSLHHLRRVRRSRARYLGQRIFYRHAAGGHPEYRNAHLRPWPPSGGQLSDGRRMAAGLADRNGMPFGTWQNRFIDWFRDLGFLQKPGVETRAARDVATFVAQPQRSSERGQTTKSSPKRT